MAPEGFKLGYNISLGMGMAFALVCLGVFMKSKKIKHNTRLKVSKNFAHFFSLFFKILLIKK